MAEPRLPGKKGRSALKEVFGDMPMTDHAHNRPIDYDSYWVDREEKGILTEPSRRRARGILPFVGVEDTVLDVGCGTGETLELLREERQITGTGLDISRKALEKVREKGFATIEIDLSRATGLLTTKWDHIVLFEVAEHVIDIEVVMENLKGCFRKGLYVSTPNLGYIAHRLRMTFGRFPVTYISDPREHVRFWTVKDFVYWSGRLGFNKPEIYGLRGKPGILELPARWPSMFASEVVYRFVP